MTDVIGQFSASMAQNATADFQPTSGVKWLINHIIVAAETEVYITDGTNSTKWQTVTSSISNANLTLHNGFYLQVKNLDTSAQVVSISGYVVV